MRNKGVGSWLTRRVRSHAGRPALIFEDDSVTYRELQTRATWAASALRELGVRSGDRVAYLGPNHPRFVETMLATWLVAGIFVPLNARLSSRELAGQLADADVAALVHAPELQDVAGQAQAKAATGTLVGAEVLTPAGNVGPHGPFDEPVTLDDPAMIMFTSGTSGVPKGVVHTHGSLTWNCMNEIVDTDLGLDEVTLITAPLFHAAALNMALLTTLIKGGASVLMGSFDADRALELVERHGVTYLHGVPTIHESLVASPRFASADLSSVRRASGGGSASLRDLAGAYGGKGVRFIARYGMTESGPGTMYFPPGGRSEGTTGGVVSFFMDARLVDEAGNDVPDCADGEITLEGPNLMAGYWRRDDPHAAELADSGWFRTGDIGRRGPDGRISVVGRVKDIFISGAENVMPAEVEAAVAEHPAVTSVAVVAVPDHRWGEVGCAVVQLEPGCRLEIGELREFLQDRLAGFKVPKHLLVVDEIPRSATGKVVRDELRRLVAARSQTPGGGTH